MRVTQLLVHYSDAYSDDYIEDLITAKRKTLRDLKLQTTNCLLVATKPRAPQ